MTELEVSFEKDSDNYYNETDLRIIKTVLNDTKTALEFSNSENYQLLSDSVRDFSKNVVDLVRAYKTVPTKRMLIESIQDSPSKIQEYNSIFSNLENVTYDVKEFKYDFEKIRNKYKSSITEQFKNTVTNLVNAEQVEELLKKYKTNLDKATPGKKVYVQKTVKEFVEDFKNTYNLKLKNELKTHGILTHSKYLDFVTNGLNYSDLVIVGGETGAGKSLHLNNFAKNIWKQNNSIYTRDNFSNGYHVIYFSLEMPYEQCFNRFIASLANVPQYGIRDATLTKEQLNKVHAALEFMKCYPFEFQIVDIPRGVTPDVLEQRIEEAFGSFKPDVIVVDYLGLMEDPTVSGDDWLKLGYITGKLHEIARAYNVLMLTAAQLNRPTTGKELVGIHRFGRSSLILHHATLALQIESRVGEHQMQDSVMHIVKNRNGSLGEYSLLKNLSNAYFEDPPEVFLPHQGVTSLLSSEKSDISKLLEEYNW
jgi:replicative DNA helicase